MLKTSLNRPVHAGARLFSVFSLICLFALLLLAAGCAPGKEIVRQPAVEPYTGPVTIEILKQSVGFRDIKTIKALTDVRVFNKGEPAGSFSGVFGYKAPDSLKTAFFGPLGLTVMEMLVTPKVLQVFLPSKNIIYEMLSPGLSLSSFMHDSRFRYVMQAEGDFYALSAYNAADSSDDPAMTYLFDKTYLLNRRIIVYRSAEQAVTLSFENFNGIVPELIRLSFSNGTAMEVTFREPEFDTEIPDGFFSRIEHADNDVLPFQELLRRFAPSR